MKWFEAKEKSAGEKRLEVTLFLYKIFGRPALDLIAFVVGFLTFLFSGDLRKFSKKYFTVLFEYTKNKALKPDFFNICKNILGYAYSLADNIEIMSGNYNLKNIEFCDSTIKNKLFFDLDNKKGAILIFSHTGNPEALRALISGGRHEVVIFLQKKHCSTFRNFVEKLSDKPSNLTVYPVEEVDITTVFEINKKIENGAVVLLAGDRISEGTSKRTIKTRLLDADIELPSGVFKMAKRFMCPVYFVSCLKFEKKYRVYLERALSENSDDIVQNWTKFLEKIILTKPHQFYHFYDYFLS